jgi:uncharacterized membrane protein
MKPFILLITVFAVSAAISKSTMGNWNLPFGGNLAMCLMLCFTAMGHFMFTKGMSMMIPPFIPFKKALIYGTGILEIILALGLLFLPIRPYAGYALILFFIIITPANIYAATQHIDIEKGTFTGPATPYLWFRIPLQLLFIGWVYYFSVSTY